VTLSGLASNPNVGAVLLVGLERTTTLALAERVAHSGGPVDSIVVGECAGSITATAEGIRRAARLSREISRLRRESISAKHLVIGLECGGSDTTSGLAANPLIGRVTDRLVSLGGCAIISESAEFIGAEQVFARRAASSTIRAEFLARVKSVEQGALDRGIDIRGTNPVPDNIRGGLTTIEEKSLGAMAKAGNATLSGVLTYGERPIASGLYFMDTPAPAVESMTALAAGGSHLILFATGVGNPVASVVSPTIKICANRNTVKSASEDIDWDASAILNEARPIDAAAEELFTFCIDIASGTLTTGEVLGRSEMAISRFAPSL
jgi:altronate dehydratase large subunit